jgi:F-type H+-transporting ATPase subunit b
MQRIVRPAATTHQNLFSPPLMRHLVAAAPVFAPFPVFAEEAKGGMPQLDPNSYPSQLFWLAVFFCLFYAFMSRVAMPRVHRIIDSRQTRIEDDLGHAGDASAAANTLNRELEASLAAAREQARKLLADAGVDMNETSTRRESELAAALHKKIEAAEAEIGHAKDQAMKTVNEIAAGIISAALPKLAPVAVNQSEIEGALSRAPLTQEAA